MKEKIINCDKCGESYPAWVHGHTCEPSKTRPESELLPCPFCGSTPYFTKSVNGNQMNYIGCSHCGFCFKAMRTDYDLDSPMTKNIVLAWNTRASGSERAG